ncbi:MAG: DNA polymerase III subunit gamma/tau [Anaerolineales bacterium]|nr:DNA polymerase III subunit gamma/tau [Anaerolineales bacterium]
MSTALYRKWRSQDFNEVIGQEHVTQTLRNALREGRVAHAYLFSGPRGTGKTSTARILAKAMNCTAPEEERPCNQCPTCVAITEGRMIDLIEIDAASNNSVDDIRELREKVSFRPSEGRFKIYIIDEVHMLSNSAFNALLKTLEEPPPHTRFILATTEPHKIPATVLSRCQRFDFRRIPAPEIATHLRHVAEAEGYTADADALLAIARSAQGCMRDAVSLLDQMTSYGSSNIALDQVQQVLGAVNLQAVIELVDALANKATGQGLTLIHKLVTDGASLTEFCQQIIEHLRGVMMLQMTGDPGLLDDLPVETIVQLQQQAKRMTLPVTLFAIKRFSEALPELKGGYQPQLPLELALIDAVQGQQSAPVIVQQIMQTGAVATEAVNAPKVVTRPKEKPNPVDAAAPAIEHTKPAQFDQQGASLLTKRWEEVLKAVQKASSPKTAGLLRSGKKDIAVSDDLVVIAFSQQYDFARELIDGKSDRQVIEQVLSTFLGRPVGLVLQVGDIATLPHGVHATSQETTSEGADPLVEYAVSDLGAQVLDEKKKA